MSLNPTKISGNCGRLMCCLKNEEEAYEYLNSKLPAVGDHVTTRDGETGDVVSVSVLKQKVKVMLHSKSEDDDDIKEVKEFDASELHFKAGKKRRNTEDDAEARKLEALERREGHHLDD